MNDDFLDAIRAAPADDAPRLIYADWLDEHGECERAEFIRVQCKIPELIGRVEKWARTPSNQPGGTRADGGPAGAALAEAQALRERERALLLSPCCQLGIDTTTVWPIEWSRGFVSSISARLAVLVGGPCERCNGRGYVDREPGDDEMNCLGCDGTSRIPGILPDVVTHPACVIETVTASDVRPIRLDCDAGSVFNWMAGSPEPQSPYQVGKELFDLLDLPFATVGGEEMLAKYAADEPAAFRALSDALIASAWRQVEERNGVGV